MSNFISLERAQAMVAKYREMKDEVLKEEYVEVLPIAETFDRAQFDTLLSKEGCTGLRIYYGMSDDLKFHAIIVGVNEANRDMITVTGSATNTSSTSNSEEENEDEEDDEIIEDGKPCPPICPEESELYP